MGSFHESMNEYKKQLDKGAIQKAYQGLMEYIMDLRTHFQTKYPELPNKSNLIKTYLTICFLRCLICWYNMTCNKSNSLLI